MQAESVVPRMSPQHRADRTRSSSGTTVGPASPSSSVPHDPAPSRQPGPAMSDPLDVPLTDADDEALLASERDAAVAVADESVPSAAQRLRIATYNIHKGVSAMSRRNRIHDLRAGLHALEADVVFLQEVQGRNDQHAGRFANWPDVAQHTFLAGDRWAEAVYGRNSVRTDGDHGNAMLSRFPARHPREHRHLGSPLRVARPAALRVRLRRRQRALHLRAPRPLRGEPRAPGRRDDRADPLARAGRCTARDRGRLQRLASSPRQASRRQPRCPRSVLRARESKRRARPARRWLRAAAEREDPQDARRRSRRARVRRCAGRRRCGRRRRARSRRPRPDASRRLLARSRPRSRCCDSTACTCAVSGSRRPAC